MDPDHPDPGTSVTHWRRFTTKILGTNGSCEAWEMVARLVRVKK
jgi:hypothetical protein